MCEDRLLQRAELCARLHADLLDQLGPGSPVRLERLRLPAAAIEGEHQVAVQMLAKRLLRHRGLELGNQIGVADECKLSFHPGLERGPPPLLQASDFGLRELLIDKVRQRGAPPER